MIYCIWYTSGGFGHFVNAVITLHGQNFVRPTNTNLTFGHDGNSHRLDLVLPKYKENNNYPIMVIDPSKNYTVLIDNGIGNESDQFLAVFPGSKVIKICYSDFSWPIVAKTMITKAVKSTLETEILKDVDAEWNNVSANWAKREKYFLFLRDHVFRSKWKSSSGCVNVAVDDLLDYENFLEQISKSGIKVADFKQTWDQWVSSNKIYVDPCLTAKQILFAVKQDKNLDLDLITDLWTQAVLYYYIWLEYTVEVPHNQFENFFSTTGEISEWLKTN